MNINGIGGFRIDPAGNTAAAGEDEGVRVFGVDDREFQIKIVWRAGDALPDRRPAAQPRLSRLLT
ncbi:hypothetical protein [Bradyrhizobium sp. ARR65]|uniref:hypothetical protein n=1 Tax=Bradyrhizobium sp. ARR65 TaxID=1040989 RepID=UPI0004658ADD